VLGLLPRRKIDARDVAGNMALGDIYGTLIQNFNSGSQAPAEPVLNWHSLPDDPEEVFTLLSWRVRLTNRLFGRDSERKTLLDWARRPGGPRLRFLTGAGGAGKSRLAAEIAQELRNEGWTAGFARLDQAAVIPIRKSGVLLLVDYPEEQRIKLVELLRDLAAIESSPAPVRVLMLSRQPVERWQREIDAANARTILDQQVVDISRLSRDDAVALYRAVSDKLVAHFKRPAASVSDHAIRQWIERDPPLHSLPLFVTAAAVHAMLEPSAALGYDGGKVVQALAQREKQRLDNAGGAAGLGESGAARLVGLAAVRGGLDATAIKRLAAPRLELGLPAPETVIDILRRLPWWNGDSIPAPTPDILAAALLFQVLAERPDQASEWLWAAVEETGAESIDRLGRLVYDTGIVHGVTERRLSQWLAAMVEADAQRATIFRFVSEQSVPRGLLPLAIAISFRLLDGAASDSERSLVLTNLSNHLYEAGENAQALDAIREAVDIHRRLAKENPARFEPDLAMSLNNLSGCLSEAGEDAQALGAISEAVDIYRRLAEENPVRFEPDLASSLNNLSNRLSKAGEDAQALDAIGKAVDIRRRLAKKNPARFEPDLALNLNNLSNRLHKAGEIAQALDAIRKAAGIYRRLAKANPARFEPDLASSLNNLSNRLSEAGENAQALDAIGEAVDIRRRLAKANPKKYGAALERSLNALERMLATHKDADQPPPPKASTQGKLARFFSRLRLRWRRREG